MVSQPTVVSLFAGIGGICLGFKQAGFEIVWANEKDAAACRTYRYNFGGEYLVEGDIRKLDMAQLPRADVLAAGFPCQSFSVAGLKKGFADTRGQLFFEVIRAIEEIQPPVVFLENVENLMEHDGGRTFQVIYSSLVEHGYILRYQPMATHEYANIPQTRRRVYIVAFRDYAMCQKFQFPVPVPLTADIHAFLDRETEQHEIYYYRTGTPFDEYIRSHATDMDGLYRVFDGVIKKYSLGKCPTLTASMSAPRNATVLRDNWGVRRLTLRESLRFQGFPQEFYFPNTIKLEDAYKQIGNSVTVPVVKAIAANIKAVLYNG
ncbi:MAG: DNA (cytosine-5-)-methyltransferase [Oscillospiraceae bacterium]|nr:DNA (cytosine-5-)-methyltransferase [Oscillospiraceae bacterium]